MGNQEEAPAEVRPPVARWVPLAAVAACAVLGVVLMLLPGERPKSRVPAPAPGAQALTAVGSGVPAALPGLAALIGEREARVRAHPQDARSWAVLGTAYVEQGRRIAEPSYFPRAEEALRTSLRTRAEGNVEALTGMAALANARRDFPAARKWAQAALELDAKRWTTYPVLIDACTGLGDHKAAKRTLDRMLELHSGPAAQIGRAHV